MLLMIDNYDSFTYNLVQYFGELGEEVQVVRNDAIDLAGIAALAPARIVISPGPCTPNEAGDSLPVIREFARLPILGVCLGASGDRPGLAARVAHAALNDVQFHPKSILTERGHVAEEISSFSAAT